MLSNKQFYHKLLRKYIVTFGNLFQNITLVRTDNDGIEINRLVVPIIFGPKERYVTRITQNPDLFKETQITLPRMSFDMTGIRYAKERKQNSLYYSQPSIDASLGVKTQYMGVPYDLDFTLYLYSRNIDDANQIVEQILPYFNPDYTPTVFLIDDINLSRDIPILMNTVKTDIDYEGMHDTVRYVIWELNFTMRAWFWGPVSSTGLIREVIANIYDDESASNIVRINTSNGNNGDYQLDDIIYQGIDINTAVAYGRVVTWDRDRNTLEFGAIQGRFTANSQVRAQSTNAVYTLASFNTQPLQLAKIDIVPNPIDALPNTDFGYVTTITEFPNI